MKIDIELSELGMKMSTKKEKGKDIDKIVGVGRLNYQTKEFIPPRHVEGRIS